MASSDYVGLTPRETVLSGNAVTELFFARTQRSHSLFIAVLNSATLGGGTLNILVDLRIATNTTATAMATLAAAVTAGFTGRFEVPAGARVYAQLTGSSAPSITIVAV